MCGRYELNATPQELRNHFGGLIPDEGWRRLLPLNSYNISPSQTALVIRRSKQEDHNTIEGLVWGFRPRWARRGWINARADTLFDSRAFGESARKRRCLAVATGWYEWRQTSEKHKQPYYVHLGRVFAFAGIWTGRKLDEGNWELSFAIVTTESLGALETIHDRMPLVMHPRHYAAWLDPATEQPQSLLRPFDDGEVRAYRVSTLVNDPKNDTAACIEPSG